MMHKERTHWSAGIGGWKCYCCRPRKTHIAKHKHSRVLRRRLKQILEIYYEDIE